LESSKNDKGKDNFNLEIDYSSLKKIKQILRLLSIEKLEKKGPYEPESQYLMSIGITPRYSNYFGQDSNLNLILKKISQNEGEKLIILPEKFILWHRKLPLFLNNFFECENEKGIPIKELSLSDEKPNSILYLKSKIHIPDQILNLLERENESNNEKRDKFSFMLSIEEGKIRSFSHLYENQIVSIHQTSNEFWINIDNTIQDTKINYQGACISRIEFEFLKKLEEDIKVIIPHLPKIEQCSFGFVTRDKKIVGLILYDMKLTHLTHTIGNLTNLKTLILDNNQIIVLPENLGNLINLRILSLRNNQLSSLPVTVGNLNKLEQLYLSNNRLNSLPKTFKNLKKLQMMLLNGNHFRSIPDALINMTELRILHFHENDLTSLPKAIENNKNLTILKLEWNSLTKIPETLGNITKLKTLRLNNNKIKSIPLSIGNLKNLECLHLYDNELSSLPESLGDLNKLQELWLGANKLVNISTTLNNLLFYLKQRGCQVHGLKVQKRKT